MELPSTLRKLYHYAKSFSLFRDDDESEIIQFCVGYEGISGGSEAIAMIANLLAEFHVVYFDVGPFSNFNYWLSPRIKRGVAAVTKTKLIICDRAAALQSVNKSIPLICSVHGFNHTAHKIDSSIANRNINVASVVHFVSEFQRSDFLNEYRNCAVIPNYTNRIALSSNTRDNIADIGLVGMMTNENKNIKRMLGVLSNLTTNSSVIWGTIPQDTVLTSKIKFKGFSTDKQEIFGSFKTFLSLSKEETFGVAVIQALSCGIPCVLSNIPAHRQHKDCIGVFLVDENNLEECLDAINNALEMAESNTTRNNIIQYWEKRFSKDIVAQQWNHLIQKLEQNVGK